MSNVDLRLGDCRDILTELEDASVDAILTDPPYELAFMGKKWDNSGIAFDVEMWEQCLRVLKPGGHLLAFGGSRTWHRLAVAIEDAGFEIRDSIAWLYGSGFPKSLDVSKAIDKRRDDEEDIRRVCRWLRARIDDHPAETIRTIAERFGFHARMVEHWAARDTDSQPTLPTLTQWDQLRDLLKFDDELDAEVYRLNLRKGEPGEAWAGRPIVGTVTEWTDRTNYALTSRDGLRRGESTNPVALQWQGWGTALKPSFEPIVVARKPLVGTVAANVLEHGTGALNIDACRVGTADKLVRPEIQRHDNEVLGKGLGAGTQVEPGGRWPTNVVLDDTQAAELGEPQRFFPVFKYQAKAPTKERPKVDGAAHPTVKPLELMRWLVNLVTPPGGVVLDPFAGSGTTVEACLLEGFDCIAIEKGADYIPLIEHRISRSTT
ncbi:methyltransferase [Mycobacterium phage Sagefire]|nr:methyltransferase [Mycobacterium phage Sagefire]